MKKISVFAACLLCSTIIISNAQAAVIPQEDDASLGSMMPVDPAAFEAIAAAEEGDISTGASASASSAKPAAAATRAPKRSREFCSEENSNLGYVFSTVTDAVSEERSNLGYFISTVAGAVSEGVSWAKSMLGFGKRVKLTRAKDMLEKHQEAIEMIRSEFKENDSKRLFGRLESERLLEIYISPVDKKGFKTIRLTSKIYKSENLDVLIKSICAQKEVSGLRFEVDESIMSLVMMGSSWPYDRIVDSVAVMIMDNPSIHSVEGWKKFAFLSLCQRQASYFKRDREKLLYAVLKERPYNRKKDLLGWRAAVDADW